MPNQNNVTNTKYVLVLTLLTIVVVLFGVILYRIGIEDVMATRKVPGNTDTEVASENRRVSTFENESRQERDSLLERAVGEFVGEDPDPAPTERSYTIPADFNENAYNPRGPDTLTVFDEELIKRYFSFIKSSRYYDACTLITRNICNARRSTIGFENFLRRLEDGYNLERIWFAEKKDDEKIYCVEYTYQLKDDANPKPIREIMQYRLRERPDGLDEISARVCEKKWKGDQERGCPIQTSKTYCLDENA